MKSNPLYRIADQYLRVMSAIEENGGELTDDLELALEECQGTFEDKIEAIAFARLEMRRVASLVESEAKLATEEAERLKRRAKMYDRAEESLERYQLKHMKAVGIDTVKTQRVTVSVRVSGSRSLECGLELEQLPERFRRIKVELDKDAVKKEIDATGVVPAGFSLKEAKTSVVIR